MTAFSPRVRNAAATTGRYLVVLVFLFTPLVTLRAGNSATVGDILLVLGAGLAALIVIFRWRKLDIPLWIWGGTALLVASIALTTTLDPSVSKPLVEIYYPTPYSSTAETGARLVLALVVLPVMVAVLADRGSTIRFAARAWIAGVTASCLVAVLDAVVGTDLQTTLANNPKEVGNYLGAVPPRFVGLGVHPTSFSVTAVMVLPFLLNEMRTSRRFLYLSPVLLIILAAVVFSASRVGYVGAVAVMALSILLNPELRGLLRRADPRVWVPILLIAGISIFLFFTGPPAYDRGVTLPGNVDVPAARLEFNSVISEQSNNVRIEFARESVTFIVDRPLTGYGFEWIESAHSIYLQLLVSGGILALVGFLWVYLGYLRRGFDLRRRFSGQMEGIRIAAVISLGSYLVMGLVQPDLLDRYLYLPAGIIMALSALPLARAAEREGASGSADQPVVGTE